MSPPRQRRASPDDKDHRYYNLAENHAQRVSEKTRTPSRVLLSYLVIQVLAIARNLLSTSPGRRRPASPPKAAAGDVEMGKGSPTLALPFAAAQRSLFLLNAGTYRSVLLASVRYISNAVSLARVSV
jgi:hypothetical protein